MMTYIAKMRMAIVFKTGLKIYWRLYLGESVLKNREITVYIIFFRAFQLNRPGSSLTVEVSGSLMENRIMISEKIFIEAKHQQVGVEKTELECLRKQEEEETTATFTVQSVQSWWGLSWRWRWHTPGHSMGQCRSPVAWEKNANPDFSRDFRWKQLTLSLLSNSSAALLWLHRSACNLPSGRQSMAILEFLTDNWIELQQSISMSILEKVDFEVVGNSERNVICFYGTVRW